MPRARIAVMSAVVALGSASARVSRQTASATAFSNAAITPPPVCDELTNVHRPRPYRAHLERYVKVESSLNHDQMNQRDVDGVQEQHRVTGLISRSMTGNSAQHTGRARV